MITGDDQEPERDSSYPATQRLDQRLAPVQREPALSAHQRSAEADDQPIMTSAWFLSSVQ